MSSSPAPEPPNYVGAAQAQGQSNIQAALTQGKVNNPNVVNPYGSQEVTWNGEQPTITQTLSPEEQAKLDQSYKTQGILGKAGTATANQIATNAGSPLNFSNAPALQTSAPSRMMGTNLTPFQSEDARMNTKKLDSSNIYNQRVIDAMMSRVNTDIGRQKEDTNSTLIAQGLRPGTAAYNNAMDMINRQQNDAEQQAILAGGAEAQRSLGMDIAARQQKGEALQTNQQLNTSNLQNMLSAKQQKAANLTTNMNLNQAQFGQSQAARQQMINELMAQRNQPFNEMAAIQGGTQINNPFAGGLGYQGGTQVTPGNIQAAVGQQGAAAQNQYNIQQANRNANVAAGAGLLSSLGGAAIQRYG